MENNVISINKEESVRIINSEIKRLKEKIKLLEEELLPFKSFTFYYEPDGKVYVSQKHFEMALPGLSYSIINPNSGIDTTQYLVGKPTQKSLLASLDSVLKDKEIVSEIKKLLDDFCKLELQIFTAPFNILSRRKIVPTKIKKNAKKVYNMPGNGKIFIKLFERLFKELGVSVNNNNIFETNKLYNIIIGLENSITTRYATIHSLIYTYKEVISILEDMVNLIEKDKLIDLTEKKLAMIHSCVNIDKNLVKCIDDLEKYNKILRDEEDKKRRSSDMYIHIWDKGYSAELKNVVKAINFKINTYNDYLDAVYNIINSTDLSLPDLNNHVINALLNPKNSEDRTENLKKILDHMNVMNPDYTNFKEIIKPMLKKMTSKTNKVIIEPNSLDEIIEMFDCYGEIINNNSLYSHDVIFIVKIIVDKIVETAKNAYNNMKELELSKRNFEIIIDSSRKGLKIVLEDEERFKNINLGIANSSLEDAQNYIPDIIKDVEEYNVLLAEKKALKQAKRIRTNVINKLNATNLDETSEFLKNKISSTNDVLILKILEKLLDEAYNDAYNSDITTYERYHELCSLAFDCSYYNRKKGILYDDENVINSLKSI